MSQDVVLFRSNMLCVLSITECDGQRMEAVSEGYTSCVRSCVRVCLIQTNSDD